MNVWVVIYRTCWGALLVLGIIGLTCVFVPEFRSMKQLQMEKSAKERENKLLAEHIETIKNNQTRFQTSPDYVEHIARGQGMVKPGEVVYKPVEARHSPPPGQGQ